MARITRATASKMADAANKAYKAEHHPQSTQSEREIALDQKRGAKAEEFTFMLREAKTITDDLLIEQQLWQTTYQMRADNNEADDDEPSNEEPATHGAIDEEELRDEEIEDELGTPRHENAGDFIQVELYGQEAAWNTILEAARMVGVTKAQRDRTQVLPSLKTRVIGSLVWNARQAGNHFEELINTRKGKDYEQAEDLEKRSAAILDVIKDQVQTLTEAATGVERSEAITDIYAHAIPSLVETLHWGLLCQTDRYSQKNDLESLKFMISIQDTLLLLCTKACSWNAKPNGSAPIKKATTQKIFPCLRGLRKSFADEHEERTRIWQNEPSQLLLIERRERQRQKLANAREHKRKRRIRAKDQNRRLSERLRPSNGGFHSD